MEKLEVGRTREHERPSEARREEPPSKVVLARREEPPSKRRASVAEGGPPLERRSGCQRARSWRVGTTARSGSTHRGCCRIGWISPYDRLRPLLIYVKTAWKEEARERKPVPKRCVWGLLSDFFHRKQLRSRSKQGCRLL